MSIHNPDSLPRQVNLLLVCFGIFVTAGTLES